MYYALLANRYLTTRAIPLIAIGAVALCVALVIIVVSVMTGFLDMVRSSGRALIGDVAITHRITGIPYYEDLITRLEAMPEVEAASPLVESWGLLKMPYPDGPNKEIKTVQIWGIEPDSFSRVTGFTDTLYWKPVEESERARLREDDFRWRVQEMLPRTYEEGRTLQTEEGDDGILLGIHISDANERERDGTYTPMRDGDWWMPRYRVTLTTLPIGSEGGFENPESFILPIVNEFASGVFLIDDSRVMIPLARAQQLMKLDESEIIDPDDPALETVLGIDPPKATMIIVRAANGISPVQLREAIEPVYDRFVAEKYADPDALVKPWDRIIPGQGGRVAIQTWEEQQARFIAPIEKERELMRILFSIIYLVCAGLVLAIFWAIVYEKTRDIGILRSLGASRMGITWIFLRYGLFVGVLGSIVGLGIAYVVIVNINTIHEAMGHRAPPWLWISVFGCSAAIFVYAIIRAASGLLLPVVLWALFALAIAGVGLVLMLHQGAMIWDPQVYYFTSIPNQMDPFTALTTMIGAVVFSLIGALVPAARAADTDPVKALGYE